MLTDRKPLPYDHQLDTGFYQGEHIACVITEGSLGEEFLYLNDDNCSGCQVASIAMAFADPDSLWEEEGREEWITGIQGVREMLEEHFNDFDPIRVIVERELAKRGF